MKKQVHPAVAGIIIIAAIFIAGYWIWYANRDRPIPDEFLSPQQAQQKAMAGMAGKMPGGQPPAPAIKPIEKGAAPAAKSAAPKEGEKPAAKESEKPAAKEDASAK